MLKNLPVIFVLSLFMTLTICAQDFIPLWNKDNVPNSTGLSVKDSIANERIFKVGMPGIWAYFPSAQENKHAAVIICPGGGYEREAYIISGTQLAKYFNSIGINAFVLKYRLPNSPDLIKRETAPLQDIQRAIKIIRTNAGKWDIDPGKVGVMGSSSGGHLASTAGTHFEDVSAVGDSTDNISYVPNFMILVSPVIDLGKYAHIGSRNNLLGPNAPQKLIDEYSNHLHVTSKTPPAFIVVAENDTAVPVQNSLMFYNALVENHVAAALHVFPYGGHSIALRNNPGSTEQWTNLCEAWLKEMKFIQ